MPFSLRYGFQIEKAMQSNGLDEDTRNRLWSCIYDYLIDASAYNTPVNERLRLALLEIFKKKYKIQSDLINDRGIREITGLLKEVFMQLKWNEVYDFLDYLLEYNSEGYYYGVLTGIFSRFIVECNAVLEQERTPYRIVGNSVCKLLASHEMLEIDKATRAKGKYLEAAKLLEKAVRDYSDRGNRDYQNCVKEAIISVETALRKITGVESGTISSLIKESIIRDKIDVHIIGLIERAYCFSSDASCVRHGAKDADRFPSKIINEKEARLMLISCSAILNYLIDTYK